MGNIIRISCPNCGFAKELHEGAGFLAVNQNAIEKVFSEEQLKEFHRLKAETKLETFMMEYRIGYCMNCNSIEAVPVLLYRRTGEGQDSVVEKGCPKCDGKMTFSDQIKICPNCLSHLTMEQVGLWD